MTHSSRGRRLRSAALAAAGLCAVLLTTGCTPEAQTPLGDTSSLEKPAQPAVDAASDGGLPAYAATFDWKRTAYEALGCDSRDEWLADGLPGDVWDAGTVTKTVVDVTGDDAADVLVQVTCPAAASTPADHVLVFDVTTARPRLLGVLGDDLFHPDATVTTDGTTVTLSGPTVADDDPYCCPGHWGTVTYAWNGARFAVEEKSERAGTGPATAQGLADGEYVGMLRSVGHDELTVDLVEWFDGDDAEAACRADDVPLNPGAWCAEYYARNADPRAVAATVSDRASLSYLDLVTMETVTVHDVAELGGTPWVSDVPDVAGYSRFRIEGGVVTGLESIYTP